MTETAQHVNRAAKTVCSYHNLEDRQTYRLFNERPIFKLNRFGFDKLQGNFFSMFEILTIR